MCTRSLGTNPSQVLADTHWCSRSQTLFAADSVANSRSQRHAFLLPNLISEPVSLSHCVGVVCGDGLYKSIHIKAQVANTRPTGRIRPSTLFYPARHLISTQRQHRALA